MKIQILKGEYLFCEQGTHVCDENGFAKIAEEDTECEISDEHYERVRNLVVSDREFRGLDANGIPLSIEPDVPENSVVVNN